MRVLRLCLLTVLIPAMCVFAAFFETGGASSIPDKIDTTLFTGERLVYAIKWNPPWYMFFMPTMEAGEMLIEQAGVEEFRGKPAFKTVMRGRSSGALSKALMPVEDEFVFYSDPETLCAEGGITKIREGKRKRLLELEYFREAGELRFRATDESVTPPKINKDVTLADIPSCVRDPFSALYIYRTLPLRNDYSNSIVIGNDDKVMEVQAHVEKQERIETQTGALNAWKIRTDALKGGLFREGGQFWVWLAADEKKTPLRFEAKVRLGQVSCILKSATP